ncbi:hypothetical protein PHYPSEUDO_011891 [Phytophthora pseudosyringae]|uniref:Uncharacterized protein n=1 Tax=Phytophthora pseudosyringae TaxID=221518 RepID=A0A8T1W7K4_9STRA|nr:hypothetical protein PHYPSEUDO_011891 [Phytophthora pseudosyringae]
MSSPPSQNDAASPATERPTGSVGENGPNTAPAEAQKPQKQQQTTKNDHSDDDYVVVDASDGSSPSRKRRRAQNGELERDMQANGAAAASAEQTRGSENKEEEDAEAPKENRHAEDGKEPQKETQQQGEAVSNGTANKEPEEQGKETIQTASEEVQANGEHVESSRAIEISARQEVTPTLAAVPSPAVHISGVDMVFPEDEVPIELCPFSSDGSVEATQPESPPRRPETAFETATFSPTTPVVLAAAPTTPPESPTTPAPTTPTSVTAEDSVTRSSVNRTIGRRKRRKKLSYGAPRSKPATKAKQEQNSVSVSPSPALENKLSISVNGHATENGSDAGFGGNAPPSPVYPDANASHLYPPTPEGEPWRWGDIDPYFDPLAQSDLDNLVRWRKENADFIAANTSAWRGVAGMESKRAVLETMLADASDSSTAHVDFPIRRGRSYRDVWEEKDFLEQQKRDSSVGETHVKSQVVKMKKKRKGAVDAGSSLLESHRDLVYGYDDDLFQEYRGRLEDRAKAYVTKLPPATPPTPPARRQQGVNTKVDESAGDSPGEEAVFDEVVLPSLPVHQLHPASLGLWKLRKNQEPDFSVVHPASINRGQVPARWKEEMKRHHQQQYELQLQQTDELADPSDGDDEGTGDSARDRLRATITNSEITGGLPSFGDCVEEDEISKALDASMKKLVPLSTYNWRTAQLVYERAACSFQCVPILEGEAAAARELEDVFLQLCPPGDSSMDIAAPPGTGLTRQPRTSQINSAPHDMIAYSVRHDIADNCSLAVAASVEFALRLGVGDVVDVLDRNGCWNYGEVVETYSEDRLGITKFMLMRFSLWSEDTVEWIAASEGRLLPHGVADGSRPCSVGPTRAHRARVRYDQSLARELERSFPQRQAKQATAASQMLAQRQHNVVIRTSTDQQKTPQKRKRKRPAKSAAVSTTS